MDRARETIFNWLAPHIIDAKCLDLFSGSGALGFEALSRGANHATLVDQNPAIILALCANKKMLMSNSLPQDSDRQICTIVKSSAAVWLRKQEQRWNIIFLDPPFGGPLLGEILSILKTGNHTETNALIYLETPQPLHEDPDWVQVKTSRVGSTHLNLITPK